ncbi:MAG TPA: carbon-nitrogen hydrolase family protein [Alphaproteobacteria bacterium]|nr:carbon-nitrogen hydrolase family protein [Alphaproteobacteria bacterium]
MTAKFTLACVQTNSGREIAPNIEAVSVQIREARNKGADFIAVPENVAMIEPDGAKLRAKAESEGTHQALAAFRALARDSGAWILVGSLAVKLDDGRIANRSFLLKPDGAIEARYDKIHMFDVDLENGESYRESATFRPGEAAVIADTPWGGLGMTVCYDLRFPYLYRSLAHAGAVMMSVPSAFTEVTGRAHWHVLLRARAIETGSFVIAPAQCGIHAEGRRTFGHSLIVDPWGEVLADGGKDVGIIMAEIDLAKVARARAMIPSLRHDRSFDAPAGPPAAKAAG